MAASDDGQLRTWVSDRLMALLGYSQGLVARLVVRLARECASAGDLAARLVDLAGFPPSPDTAAFAEDVYGRVPRSCGGGGDDAGVSEYQRQMQEAAAMAKKQSTIKLLDDDGEIGVSASPSSGGRKRFRRKAVGEDDDDAGRNARRRRSPDDEEEDGDTSEEEEMDQIEMAQLEGNIRRPARGGRGGRRDRAAPSPRAAWGNLAPPWEPPSPAARTLREHRSRGRKEKQRKRKGRERR